MLYPCFHFDINIETRNLCEINAKMQLHILELSTLCNDSSMSHYSHAITCTKGNTGLCAGAQPTTRRTTSTRTTRTRGDKHKDEQYTRTSSIIYASRARTRARERQEGQRLQDGAQGGITLWSHLMSRYVPSCGSAEVVEASLKALLMAAEMTVDCHLAERMRIRSARCVPPALSRSQGLSAAAQRRF